MLLKPRKRRRLAATAMEYLVVASLILVAVIYGVGAFGRSVLEMFDGDNTALEKVSEGSGSSGP